MPLAEVGVATRDGTLPTTLVRPRGAGTWPAAILYSDAIGVRPAMLEIAERLALHGYLVLVPDLFWRARPQQRPPDAQTFSTDAAARAAWMSSGFTTANHANVRADTDGLLHWLTRREDVVHPAVGVFGYCMGGNRALAVAGAFPERVVAAASFHGGNLATDAPDSPHLLAPRMKARVYVAAAVDDSSFPDDMKRRLDSALADARVPHQIETYAGCLHGWVPSDTPVHDPPGAERAFHALVHLFDNTLER